MFWPYLRAAALAALTSILIGCTEPPVPLAIQQALSQEQDLWRAGAAVYAPQAYQDYLAALSSSRDLLAREKAKFSWFRNYDLAAGRFQEVLSQGEALRDRIESQRAQEGEELKGRLAEMAPRVKTLRTLAETVKDKRLARGHLVQAELLLAEAQALQRAGKEGEALKKLAAIEDHVDAMIKAVKPLISRYADRGQISAWRQLVNEAVSESKRTGGYVIVVNKLERELTLYRNGVAVRTFPAGLGFNFLSDKLYSGDRATPEGRYQVIKKVPGSKYYRALLINYPNSDDQKRFSQAKRMNRIPKNATIGGLIEIHGGGTEGMTYGCVALDNNHIEELFRIVDVGTPVVIVGAVGVNNFITASLEGLN